MISADNSLVRAIELQHQGRLDESTRILARMLKTHPDNPAILYSLGLNYLNTGKLAEALQLVDQGIGVAPQFMPIRLLRANILQRLGSKTEALQAYDAALAIDPNDVSALLNSGALLRDMLRHKEALIRFNHILTFDPDNTGALANCAILLTEFKQSELAIPRFQRLLQLSPDFDYGLGLLCYERLHLCDWTDFAALSGRIIEGVRAGKRACKTLAFMAISDSARDQLLAARIFAQHFFPSSTTPLWQGERYRHDKIRLAYVSPDLREHPVGHLMAGVFEHHDKSRFETIAISLGSNDGSRLRKRMLNAFDKFIDVKDLGTPQIAQMMREMEIDIAVDLAGYTSDSRTAIFAHRPAPVQVNYLGYPGTMGVDYMDYILADRHVIPLEHQQYYSESVVYLPDTYLPTAGGIRISDRTPSRSECELPETGFVFCSFSHDYKISPPLFDVWMRILKRVPGSVLWLMSRGETQQRNLGSAAELRDIDPSRLVFAGRVPLVEDHLARYRQADLFLDTHPYNAHTTAADALMAGLPVLTYMGNAFPARVAGSLLQTAGIPALITQSLQEYETLAVKIATDPTLLHETKARLVASIATSPLFDTRGFCRNLEACYISMQRQVQLRDARDALCRPD